MNQLSVPIGNIDLLNRKKTAFLSSRRIPSLCMPNIVKWVESLSPEEDCVLCGNIQQIEGEVLQAIAMRKVPIVLVLASPYPKMWPTFMVDAIGDQRMLVITMADFVLPWVDKSGVAAQRNKFMIANAEKVVVGLCRPGGNLEKQLAAASNVVYLNDYASVAAAEMGGR